MPFKLERWGDKAIVTNTLTGKHYSSLPIPLKNAKAQMRVLEAAVKKEDPPMMKTKPMLTYR